MTQSNLIVAQTVGNLALQTIQTMEMTGSFHPVPMAAPGPVSAGTLEPAFFYPSPDVGPSRSSLRYFLAGTAITAVGTALAGCRSDPAPAPIPHESALPANQGNCPPNSRDPFCMGYKASVGEMRREREEGHHTDQALTAWLVGIAILLVGIPSAIIIIRRSRKIKRLEASLKAAGVTPEPPKPGLISRLFRRRPKPAALEAPPQDPAATPEAATVAVTTDITSKGKS
ncbi:MAG TPA: hypothetical protein VLJ37_09445 [bacterium]|nr:hypothetical protein [bacterium]